MGGPDPPHRTPPGLFARAFWLGLGWLSVALGAIGAFLPIMPTVVFLILAAGCFARSSPRMEAWIVDHPLFGGHVRAWRDRQAIAPRGKLFAVGGIAGGYLSFWWIVGPTLPLALLVGALMGAAAAFILTRPD